MPRNTAQVTRRDEQARIGATLRSFREKCGLKPDEAANQVPISRSYLVNIEAGRKALTPILCARFSAIYNVPQAALVPEGYFVADVETVPA